MQVVNIPTFQDLIRTVAVKHRIPLMAWGPPGVAKSESVWQVCDELDGIMVDRRLSQYDSIDFRGIPKVIVASDQADADPLTTWCKPGEMPFKGNNRFPDDRLIFLFLDEVNSGLPSTLAVAYQLVNDRRVNEHELKDNVVIICAGNREGDRGVVNRMPLPLLNRMCQVEIAVDHKAWAMWAQGAGVAPTMIAYVMWQPTDLMTFDPTNGEKVFASPRTWFRSSQLYADNLPKPLLTAAMSGLIGEGLTAKFMAFDQHFTTIVPLMEKILKDPERADVPEELSLKYAVAMHLSGAMDVDTVKNIQTYLDRLPPDLVVMAWNFAVKRDPQLMTTDTFLLHYGKKYRSLFRED